LGNYFSRRGFVTIVVDYRRIPDTGKFPDSAEDLSLSLQWLAQSLIAEADLDCVFYLGASAG
jgi:acetyl esterase/lipase